MNKKVYWIFIIIFMIALSPLWGQDEGVASLSLEDCIIKAMKNNLKVAVEVYNPDIAEASLTLAKEQFMPYFDLNLGLRRNENPSYWFLQGEGTVINNFRNYSFAVNQKIPTGGTVKASLNSYRSKTNEAFQLINPRYGSTLQLDFTQPLLKDFGFKVTRKEILIAQNNLDISYNQFRAVIMDTIYLIQEAYWNLVYAIDDYQVKQQSLALARDLLVKNRKEVEVGKIAPIEVLNAEATVASREADILQAEMLIRKREDWLRNLLNLTTGEGLEQQKIVPTDTPKFEIKVISFDAALQEAIQNRPDLKISATNIENRELNLSVAKNQMLPGLNLNLSYWSPGVSGDRILYLDNNPFTGVVVGREAGSAGGSLKDSFKQLYNNWEVGLTLTLPLSTVTTRANLVKARMELQKSLLVLEDNKKQALLEVRDAVRDIEAHAKRVEAYRAARDLAEKRLHAEVRKLEVGLTTNYFVLQYQEELGNARSLEIRSLIDYNLAWAKLDKAMGTSLDKHGIRFADFE